MTLDELRAALRNYPGSLAELADCMGIRRQTVSRIARGTRGASRALRAHFAVALAMPRLPRRPDRRLLDAERLNEAWLDTEARGPTSRETTAAWDRVRDELERFGRIPPHQRTDEDWAPAETALRAWEQLERPTVRYGSDTDEVAKLQRRVERRQRAGLVPAIIEGDDTEESWDPTREELQIRMIPRADFAAWAARPYTPSGEGRTGPPVGDLDHPPRSPQLQKFLSAFPAMRAFRDELQGGHPADPIRQAIECLCAEIAGAARWARTVERETALATARANPVTVIYERGSDGRWIASIPELPSARTSPASSAPTPSVARTSSPTTKHRHRDARIAG
jgi:transcriptional regulator with XRE-family HTH domain